MKFVVFITKEVSNQATSHNLSNEIALIKRKVEIDQTTTIFDRFLPSPYIRKYVGSNFRLIATIKNIGDLFFVVFLQLLPRGSREYKKWLTEIKLFESFIPTDDELLNYYSENYKEDQIPELPPLNESESLYLYNKTVELAKDNEIVETKSWIEEIQKENFIAYQSKFAELISQILDNIEEYRNQNIIYESKNNIGIVYKYFPMYRILLLIIPTIGLTEQEIQDHIPDEFLEDFINDFEDYDEKKILENSRKAYPDLILADHDLWFKIEKNDIANLALSLEEARILDNIRFGTDGGKRFPVFINGRPGSGKSTILQFLFADQIFNFFKMEKSIRIPFRPIYITYNHKLLDFAKSNIKKIIESNTSKITDKKIIDNPYDFYNEYVKSFTTLRELLLGFIDVQERASFSSERYVDFGRFKELFNSEIHKNPDAYIRNKLNPETAWHIIRNFIKGRAIDNKQYLDIVDYENDYQREHKRIPVDLFKKVYSEIWLKWYKPLCDNMDIWDDQDLALKVISTKSKDELGKYSAVFCDEAQDFTQLELKLIMSLTYYKNRVLPSEAIKDIPIAFAGDPFQTINPTGFDWDFVGANFYNEVIKELIKFDLHSKLEFNYHELEYNYRSDVSIVKFNNLVQLFRGTLFSIKNLIPQKTWFPSVPNEPRFFLNTHIEIEKQISDNEELVIIIPCQEGEEEKWVSEDPLLSKLALKDGNLTRNIVSPISVKGMEFNRVVLYNFGKQAIVNFHSIKNFYDLQQITKMLAESPEDKLRLEYFLNSLYVASSRPKHLLFIVDTETGKEKFWDYFSDTNNQLIGNYSLVSKSASQFEDNITGFTVGKDDDWDEHKDNPLELAIMFEEQGIQNNNCDDLKRAEQNYLRANEEKKAKFVRGKIYEVLGEYHKAGKIFEELGKFEEAFKCFWKSKNYQSIININSIANNQIYYSPKYKSSVFMLEQSSTANPPSKFLNYIYDNVSDESNNNHKKLLIEINDDPTWREVITELFVRLYKYKSIEEQFNFESITRLIDIMYDYLPVQSSYLELGYIYLYAEQKVKALEYWANLPATQRPNEFNSLMAETQNFPENLKWFLKINELSKIYEAYKDNKDSLIKLDAGDLSIIIDTLIELQKQDDIFDLLALVDEEKLEIAIDRIKYIFQNSTTIPFNKTILEFINDNFNAREIDQLLNNSFNKQINSNVTLFVIAHIRNLFDRKQIGKLYSEYESKFLVGKRYEKYIPTINKYILQRMLNFDRTENTNLRVVQDLTLLFKKIVEVDSRINPITLNNFNGYVNIIDLVGSIRDRLDFYNDIISDNISINKNQADEIRQLAKERLVYARNNPDKNRKASEVRDFKESAQKLFKEYHLTTKYDSINDIPEQLEVDENTFDFVAEFHSSILNKTKKEISSLPDITKHLYSNAKVQDDLNALSKQKGPKTINEIEFQKDLNNKPSNSPVINESKQNDNKRNHEGSSQVSSVSSLSYSYSINLLIGSDKYLVEVDKTLPKTKVTRHFNNDDERATIWHQNNVIRIDFPDDFKEDNQTSFNESWLIGFKFLDNSISVIDKDSKSELFRIIKNEKGNQ
ncbi:MAG: hypothetical protein K8F60_18500 [Melioribacteraceae bacterium]|nr:hypothetical protein [Melioribacteraceae bacterium]